MESKFKPNVSPQQASMVTVSAHSFEGDQSLGQKLTDPRAWILLVEYFAIWHINAIGIDFQLISGNRILPAKLVRNLQPS